MKSATKKCNHCGSDKPIKEFDLKYDGSPGRRRSRCSNCRRKLDRLRRRSNVHAWKDWAGGECVVCGYKKCEEALEFHHRDPSEKESSVSQICREYSPFTAIQSSIDKVTAEMAKCDLLCANCHRELHYTETNSVS